MPAWLFGGSRQRTKRLEKSASEGDTRIDDNSGGSPLTIEIGAEFPIGINVADELVPSRGVARKTRLIRGHDKITQTA
jgi:hypothetical protein